MKSSFENDKSQLKSDKLEDYKDECPRFICNDKETEKQSFSRYLSDQVFCYKSDFEDPLNVYLKDCSNVAYQPGNEYDVFGNPFLKGSDRTQFCHGELNRCMLDPYVKVTDRLLGSACQVNYHCLSGFCNQEIGKCDIDKDSKEDSNRCESHENCQPGYFCNSTGMCDTQRKEGQQCGK